MIIGPPTNPHRPPETSADYLQRVRESSNYHALRSIIGVVFWVLVVALWVYCVLILSMTGALPFASGPSSAGGGYALVGILMVVAYAGIGTLLLVACRQAAVVVLDIADTLQEAHRRK